MSGRRSGRVDFLQNVAIAALSVSAVALFAQTQMFRLAVRTLEGYFQPYAQTEAQDRLEAAPLAVPTRLAVSGPGGRHGELFLTTGDAAFPAELFAAALGGDAAAEDVSEETFLAALDAPSLYADFLHPLPLSLLAGLTGAAAVESDDDVPVRQMALAAEADGTVLYLRDGSGMCRRRPAPVSAAVLTEAVERYGPADAFFAGDREEAAYQAVDPLSLLPTETPSLSALDAVSGAAGEDRLLSVLGFNPRTNFRYTEANGTEVVVEGERSVRLRANGSVYYQSGGGTALRVAGADEGLYGAAAGCAALLDAMVSSGGAAAYPCQARREEGRTVLCFGWQYQGVPIRFPDGSYAAEIVLEGDVVSTLEARLRRYAPAGEDSLLLPLSQALGLASERPGAEVSAGYADGGGRRVDARWMLG